MAILKNAPKLKNSPFNSFYIKPDINEAELIAERQLITERNAKNNELKQMNDATARFIIASNKLKKVKLNSEQQDTLKKNWSLNAANNINITLQDNDCVTSKDNSMREISCLNRVPHSTHNSRIDSNKNAFAALSGKVNISNRSSSSKSAEAKLNSTNVKINSLLSRLNSTENRFYALLNNTNDALLMPPPSTMNGTAVCSNQQITSNNDSSISGAGENQDLATNMEHSQQ
jgi:hypothetical protein